MAALDGSRIPPHVNGEPDGLLGAPVRYSDSDEPGSDGRLSPEQQNDSMERLLRRISYDLHDGPIQTLSAALLELQLASQQTSPAERLQRNGNVRTLIESALAEIREIGSSLRPRALEANGLQAMFRQFLAERGRCNPGVGIQFADDSGIGDVQLSPSARIALFRIVQESVNNALKHAGARCIAVRVGVTDTHVICVVSDDGRGFIIPDGAMQSRRSHGLTYMQDRARLLGGELELVSSVGRGTTITVRLPIWR